MADFPRYEGAASRCSKMAQQGVVEFMEWAVRDYGRGARNLGIYNCRTVRGSVNRSIHGDGRAGDVGFSGSGNPAGTALLNLLLPHVRQLGIQMIIWNRRIWSAKAPNGARYQGTASHTDHLHIEFTWDAARTLTRERVRQIVGGTAITPPAPKPQPDPPPDLEALNRLLQEEQDMILICPGKGIAHVIDSRCWSSINVAELADVRKRYADVNRPLPELTVSPDRWNQYLS